MLAFVNSSQALGRFVRASDLCPSKLVEEFAEHNEKFKSYVK